MRTMAERLSCLNINQCDETAAVAAATVMKTAAAAAAAQRFGCCYNNDQSVNRKNQNRFLPADEQTRMHDHHRGE